MSKGNLQSLFCGILFCISITALIIACLSFVKNRGGEYYSTIGVGGSEGPGLGHGTHIPCTQYQHWLCDKDAGDNAYKCCGGPGGAGSPGCRKHDPKVNCPGHCKGPYAASCGTSTRWDSGLHGTTTWQAGPGCCQTNGFTVCNARKAGNNWEAGELGPPVAWNVGGNIKCVTQKQHDWFKAQVDAGLLPASDMPLSICKCTGSGGGSRVGAGGPKLTDQQAWGDSCIISGTTNSAPFDPYTGEFFEPLGTCAVVGDTNPPPPEPLRGQGAPP